MNVSAAIHVDMQHGAKVVLVTLEPSESDSLDVIQHLPDLVIRRLIVDMPADHPGTVAMNVGQGVD